MLKYEETHHSYYCENVNFYNNKISKVFSNWKDFKENWLETTWLPEQIPTDEMDDDLNHIFRFDIRDNERGGLLLELFFMLQKKGIFLPITIKYIKESDMPEINEFLIQRWNYLKNQWIEFSE